MATASLLHSGKFFVFRFLVSQQFVDMKVLDGTVDDKLRQCTIVSSLDPEVGQTLIRR